jgi:hypothetical protein
MKALKSTSVQVLIVGGLLCCGIYQFTDTTVTMIFATAFTTIVAGRKGRDLIQSNKGMYYEDGKLHNAKTVSNLGYKNDK